jgi:APA family basic amino acid/polyamine antiporter
MATFAVIAAALLVSSFLPTIGLSVFPVHPDGHGGFITDLATRWKDDPVAGIVTFFRPQALAFWAGIWVAILAFTILVIATNAGLIGISRLSYSLAAHDLFPGVFARLHPRFRTPLVSIVVFGVVAALLIVPAQIDLMASVYALAATFAFATAHIAVMRLRFVEPDLRRPFEMPLNIRLGRARVPLLSVIGALAIGAVFTQLFFQNIQGSTFIYAGWLVAGVLIYTAYRRYRKKSLWQPLASPPPARVTRPLRAYERIGAHYDQRVHLGRRPVRPAAVPAGPAHERTRGDRVLGALARLRNPWRILAMAGLLAGMGVVVAGLSLGLSNGSGFGPGLAWLPGLLLIGLLVAFLLVRGSRER